MCQLVHHRTPEPLRQVDPLKALSPPACYLCLSQNHCDILPWAWPAYLYSMVKGRRSAPEHHSTTCNFSTAPLRHLYFSRGKFWSSVRYGERSMGIIMQQIMTKKGHQYILKMILSKKVILRTMMTKKRKKRSSYFLHMTVCGIVCAPTHLECYFDHCPYFSISSTQHSALRASAFGLSNNKWHW